MARFCKQCGRPLDPDHHDIGKTPRIIIERGKIRKARDYGCRVRLVATNPITGKTFVPNHPQRIARLNVRYVPEELFKTTLKP